MVKSLKEPARLSIVAIERLFPTLGLYLCWLGAAVWAALLTGILRPRKTFVDQRIAAHDSTALDPAALSVRRTTDLSNVLTLVLSAIASFAAWAIVPLIYGSFKHLPVDVNGNVILSPADLVLLQLLAPTVGWAIGYSVLQKRHAVWVVGYRLRRLMSGAMTGTLGIFIALPIVFFALQGTTWYWDRIQYVHPAKHDLLLAMDATPSRWVRAGAVIAAVIVAPLFEELLFRGFIQGAVRRATRSPVLAIAISSVLFSAIHPPWTIPPIFVFAILLGCVYERTHNLWATTIMHALFNLFAILTQGM